MNRLLMRSSKKLLRLCRTAKVALMLLLAVVPNFFIEPCCCVAREICCCEKSDKQECDTQSASSCEDQCCQPQAKVTQSCCGEGSDCSPEPTNQPLPNIPEQLLKDVDQPENGCENCKLHVRVEQYEPRSFSLEVPTPEPASLDFGLGEERSGDLRPDAAPLPTQRLQALLEVWIE